MRKRFVQWGCPVKHVIILLLGVESGVFTGGIFALLKAFSSAASVVLCACSSVKMNRELILFCVLLLMMLCPVFRTHGQARFSALARLFMQAGFS
jgi:hypothetical protein